jgi:hypothetical protein
MENWGACGCRVRISGTRSAAVYATGNNPAPSWLKKYAVFFLSMSMDGCRCRIQYLVASDHGVNAVYSIIAQCHTWNFIL